MTDRMRVAKLTRTIAVMALGCLITGGAAAAQVEARAADQPATGQDRADPVPVPAAPLKRPEAFDNLFKLLAKAPNTSEADQIKSRIRELWTTSGSPTVDLLLSRGSDAALLHDTQTQRRLLVAATRLAPDNPEAWNRRAELDYNEQRVTDAVAEIGYVLAIEPRQFDALEGLANIMTETGRNDLALKALRQLKTIDPTSANLEDKIGDLERKVEGQKI